MERGWGEEGEEEIAGEDDGPVEREAEARVEEGDR